MKPCQGLALTRRLGVESDSSGSHAAIAANASVCADALDSRESASEDRPNHSSAAIDLLGESQKRPSRVSEDGLDWKRDNWITVNLRQHNIGHVSK